jgi:hypothetical protein
MDIMGEKAAAEATMAAKAGDHAQSAQQLGTVTIHSINAAVWSVGPATAVTSELMGDVSCSTVWPGTRHGCTGATLSKRIPMVRILFKVLGKERASGHRKLVISQKKI